jgi:aspartate/methionine/tyrosine aminotransferase
MPFAPSSRSSAVAPFIVMNVMQQAADREAAGADVIHLEVGQPGTAAPRGAAAAARRAIDTDVLGYTLTLGIPGLRERICRHYQEWYGLGLPPGRIGVTTGSSAAFLLSFMASFDPGDRVLLTDPSYPCYRNILHALGIEVVRIPAGPDTRYQVDAAMLDDVQDLAGVVCASPSNPTGSLLSAPALKSLAEACDRRGIRLVSDEIYHGLVYDGVAASAAGYSDSAVVINSFSKYFSMTGWRVGWMVMPEDLVPAIERLAANFFISPPGVSQVAALAALDCADELEANKAVYAANRALLLDRLPKMGIDKLAPADGAFYIYADIGDRIEDSEAFAAQLLNEAGVAITPGIDFDPDRGHRTIRFSYCVSQQNVQMGLDRMEAWLQHR